MEVACATPHPPLAHQNHAQPWWDMHKDSSRYILGQKSGAEAAVHPAQRHLSSTINGCRQKLGVGVCGASRRTACQLHPSCIVHRYPTSALGSASQIYLQLAAGAWGHARHKTAVQGMISTPFEAVSPKPLCLHLSPTPGHLYTGDFPPLSPTWAASAGCLGNRLRRQERRCRGRKELLLHPLLKCVSNLIEMVRRAPSRAVEVPAAPLA